MRIYSTWLLLRIQAIVIATFGVFAIHIPNGEAQYPYLENMKSTKLYLSVFVDRNAGTAKVLRARAVQILKEHGVAISEEGIDDQAPLLDLNLSLYELESQGQIPSLGKTCPGKRIYIRKLELWENVRVDRMSDKTIRAVTWRRFIPVPEVVDVMSLERLLLDGERLIREFALDYRQANQH